MPYKWTNTGAAPERELHLWPHQSLPPKGYAGFVLATFGLILLPLFFLLGSVALWGILPFAMLAVGGIWLALERSHRNAQIIEILTLSDVNARLTRRNPDGTAQEWSCNRYWVMPEMHDSDGPVPCYVTLKGCGRNVEIGAFLSEDERKALYRELVRVFRQG